MDVPSLAMSPYGSAPRRRESSVEEDARAQQPSRLPTIGLLGPNLASGDRPLIATIRQRLSELGWVEGRNINFEYRSAEGRLERAAEIAARLNVDVIVTGGDGQVLGQDSMFHSSLIGRDLGPT